MKELTKAEEVLLLAIWRLGENAYGVTIRKQVADVTGKVYAYGTLYGLLDQLSNKDYVEKILGEPSPERGGRSKTYYRLSPTGIASLKSAIEMHRSVWKGVSEYSFDEHGV